MHEVEIRTKTGGGDLCVCERERHCAHQNQWFSNTGQEQIHTKIHAFSCINRFTDTHIPVYLI